MINQLAKETHDNAQSKGFNHDDIPRLLCLVHSEVSEALEAHRSDLYCTMPIYNDAEKAEALINNSYFEAYIKNTFEDELADIILRVMGIAHSKGIDLEFHIRAKMNYNASRAHKHGGKKY